MHVRPHHPQAMKLLTLATMLLALTSCNEPPLYESRARTTLQHKGTDPELIERLVMKGPLSAKEAEALLADASVPVLHLLASNPTTPQPILLQLAKHKNFEVTTGLVINPATPIDIVLSFRTPGKYTTVNDSIIRNPKVPDKVFVEMFDGHETGYVSPALNPRCPPDIQWRIYREGDQNAHVWLAANPNLQPALIERLAADNDPLVMQFLRTNPAYRIHTESQRRKEAK